MKQVEFCLICGKPVAKSLSYQVIAKERVKNPITGEFKFVETEGKMCPSCNKTMGFATSQKKLAKFEEVKQDEDSNQK